MAARKPPAKDRLTKLHQWITVFAIPISIALAVPFVLWFASTFDGIRIDMATVKTTLGFVEQDIGRHSTQLGDIQKQLAKRK
jgi:hypothetical protein